MQAGNKYIKQTDCTEMYIHMHALNASRQNGDN